MKKLSLLSTLFLLMSFSYLHADRLTINCGFQQPEAGLVTEVLETIFKEAKIGLKVQILPNKRSLMNANNGVDDGDATRIWDINKYYPNLLRVPLQTHHIDIVALSNKKIIIEKFEDLKNYHVGIVRGMKITEVKVGAVKPRSITSINDYDQLLRMLSSHRIDVIISDKTSLLNNIKKTGIKDLYLVKKPLLTLPLYIHLHKKNSTYIPKLVAAISDLKKRGVLSKIQDAFFDKLEKEVSNLVTVIKSN